MLDGLEVMLRQRAHHLLLDWLVKRGVPRPAVDGLEKRLAMWLARPAGKRESSAEAVFGQFGRTWPADWPNCQGARRWASYSQRAPQTTWADT